MRRLVPPIVAHLATIAFGVLMFLWHGVYDRPVGFLVVLAAFLCLSVVATYIAQRAPPK